MSVSVNFLTNETLQLWPVDIKSTGREVQPQDQGKYVWVWVWGILLYFFLNGWFAWRLESYPVFFVVIGLGYLCSRAGFHPFTLSYLLLLWQFITRSVVS